MPVRPAYGRDITTPEPIHVIDTEFALGSPRSVARAVFRDIPSTVVPDDWYPQFPESFGPSERIARWGVVALGAHRNSYDQWGLFHRFALGGDEHEATLVDQIHRMPDAETTRDEAIAVARTIGERLRDMLAATVPHPIVATGRASGRTRLGRTLWNIDGEIAGVSVELEGSVSAKDLALVTTNWKFSTVTLHVEGRVAGVEITGTYREGVGSLRTSTGDRFEWAPGRLAINDTEFWFDGTNIRSQNVATWFALDPAHRDTDAGTLDVDSPIVALGPDAENRHAIVPVGLAILVQTGVYRHRPD